MRFITEPKRMHDLLLSAVGLLLLSPLLHLRSPNAY